MNQPKTPDELIHYRLESLDLPFCRVKRPGMPYNLEDYPKRTTNINNVTCPDCFECYRKQNMKYETYIDREKKYQDNSLAIGLHRAMITLAQIH